MLAGAVLLAGTVLGVILGRIRYDNRAPHGPSLQQFAAAINIPGALESRDEPLGDTEAMRGRVQDILQFDDYVYRTYRFAGGGEAGLYVAYWRGGKQRFREMSRHTPDVCWVEGGWKVLKVDFSRDAAPMPPAQYRRYALSNTEVDVLFWQLAEGQSVAYPTTSLILPLSLQLRDFRLMGFRQRGEQYFVRLSFNRPIDDPALGEVRAAFMKALAPLTQR